ncbi:unknown protein [Seminavis robusta]|uniref:Uncharacterized protein n=1 Tax=Seminavis robusta TaxID=568900 RepID=A0A9N8HNS9_9STRA|nr:unknown protein [Seminavis robusta]|eukprot:Sro1011_g231070.1 n/a (199) ;mRNA; r:25464-26060
MMMQEKPKEKEKEKAKAKVNIMLSSDSEDDTEDEELLARYKKAAIEKRRKAELSLSQALESSSEDEDDTSTALEEGDVPLLAQLTEEETRARQEEAEADRQKAAPKETSYLQEMHQLQQQVPFHHKQYPPAETGQGVPPPPYPARTNPVAVPQWQRNFRNSYQRTAASEEHHRQMNFYQMEYVPGTPLPHSGVAGLPP